jgi:DNA-binding CsgD family transcriptional regulator
VTSEGYAWSGVEARYGVFSRPGSKFPDTHTAPVAPLRRPAFAGVVHRNEDALADALDGITAAFFLVDPMRRPVHANASGRALLARGEIVRTIGDRLTPCDERACKTFNRIFSNAQSASPAGFKSAAVPLPAADGELWMAHILPLAEGSRRQAGVGYAAAMAVLVRRAVLDLSSPLETLAETYQLTPGETRVLGSIVESGSVPEAARALRVSETTVKTHLCHVFDKTGTKRQAELVKLVAGFANPLGM